LIKYDGLVANQMTGGGCSPLLITGIGNLCMNSYVTINDETKF
jgi:hypothetical protein